MSTSSRASSTISKKEAKNIVVNADLPDGPVARDLKLASAPKTLRQSLIRGNKDSEESRSSAAIEIQRQYRGYNTRCKVLGVVEPKISKTAVYSGSNHVANRLSDVRSPSPVQVESSTKINDEILKEVSEDDTLEALYAEYVRRLRLAGVTDIPSFEEFCRDQNLMQTAREEKGVTQSSRETVKSDKKTPATSSRIMKPGKIGKYTADEAASMIQRSWRRHIDIQVYKYYRDLINFKQRGDPALMLRCINPNEARLLDAASGIHVKFRLAGDKFPPNIYYKIYTHRNVVDMCANSPKDYTKADSKRKMGRDVHNKGDRASHIKAKVGWYQRWENNGWRLVSDRLLTHILADPVTWETSQKKIEFHHNKLQRKQDVEKQRKQKKINWMQKMYKEGMMKAKVEDTETIQLIEGAAAGMVATIEMEGPEAVQEWEVDELLEWTTSLNYDDYLDGWKEIATSSKSEKITGESQEDGRAHVYSGQYEDPFMLTISGSPSRNQDIPTRPSHNTPVSSLSGSHFR
ncbi:protein MFI-like isoform X2 [Lineus longissimus]|uniref:protein MFI-like isoform X2 n=1 Tax=Lineus longissimus TaxID=88925 RepID=UPI00315D6AD5